MTRYFVLGSTGFIGRAVCKVVRDHPSLGEVTAHRRGDPRVEVSGDEHEVVMDVSRRSVPDLALAFAQHAPDVIVNCIGSTNGSPAALAAANVDVVEAILEALDERPHTQLVQIGSAAEYGMTVTDRPVRESDAPAPIGAYGATKLQATRLVLGAVAQGRCRGTVLRVFNPVGPGSSERTLVGRAARLIEDAVATGREAVHLGSLASARDFIDVRDVAWAIVASCTSPIASGALLNVGRGLAVPCREMVRLLADEVGYAGEVVEDETGSVRSGSVTWQAADTSAIRNRLAWTPRHTLEQAVAALWTERAGVRTPCMGT